MSDNEDLLGDDLGDHNLGDYNLGNEEEEQLLADDYEAGASQNVPSSISSYGSSTEYANSQVQYNEPVRYQMPVEPESVVPSITVEVPNTPLPTYAPYEPRAYEQQVPPAIPASPMESPQTVPIGMASIPMENDMGPRERFISERPPGAQRMPQVRDIPDSLDKVVVPRGLFPPRGRTTWRNPHFSARHHAHYRRNNIIRGNFQQRPSFPPPRQNIPQMRPEIRPDVIPEMPPMMPPEMSPERPIMPQERPIPNPVPREPFQPMERPQMDLRPPMDRPPMDRPPMDRPPMDRPPMDRPPMDRPPMDRPPMDRPPMDRPPMDRQPMDRPPMDPRFRFPHQYEPRPHFQMRPHFERPMFFPPRPFHPRFGPPMRDIAPNVSHIPQVTIRHGIPQREPEVRMLPVQLPPNLPPGGLAGKKVLINPHFKGNFQPPVEGLPVQLPAYIPTRIQKSPPLSPTLENKFGPIKDIDDAAERFIAEQRNALARAAARKVQRRSPQRFIENTTIQVENELCDRRSEEEELLRRQEEFINANRAGLRRRMRSPSPLRRSPSPRRSPERRARNDTRPAAPQDEQDSEYKRRMREQESLRERVLRAKEVRRRKNAVAAQKMQDKEHDKPKDEPLPQPQQPKDRPQPQPKPDTRPEPEAEQIKPDTTRKSPEKESEKENEREQSPDKESEVNSTCDNPALSPTTTPPLTDRMRVSAVSAPDSDDDLDLILGDIDGILSDDDDTGRFKTAKEEKTAPKPTKPAAKPAPPVDLRSKLPPKEAKKPRQKIVFSDKEKEREDRKRKDRTPPRKTLVSSSTKTDDSGIAEKKSKIQPKDNQDISKPRQRIIFDKKETEQDKPKPETEKDQPKFSNRRVILQRNQTKDKSVFARIEVKTDLSKPNPGIFSRAVRTAIGGTDKNRIVIKKDEPQIEYASDSDIDEDSLLDSITGNLALVQNLPHGMTDTRLKTLAGSDVQSLVLDKEDRSAKITFKTTIAAETFRKKFNSKMVAASRLTVTLR